VFLNILSNAAKFTDRKGKIILVFEKIKENNKEVLRISVSDNGAGIKEKDQDKLFMLFGSIKDEKKQINT
jgi:signal transduction histidine kinase